MQLSLSLWVYFSVLAAVYGQSLDRVRASLPACVTTCQAQHVPRSCNITDATAFAECLCPDETVLREISVCVQANCNYEDQVANIERHQALCSNYPAPSRKKWIYNVAIILLCITIPFILSRLHSRLVITKHTGLDDVTFVIASVLSVATTVLLFPLADLGFGAHLWDIDPNDATKVGIILTKVAIVLFYLHIFPYKFVRVGSYLSLVFLGSKLIIFLFVVIFQCTPIDSTWDRSIPGHCVNMRVLVYLAGGLSLFEDLVILFLPIPNLVTLNMSIGKKTTAITLFSVGSLACIASALRIKFLGELENGPHGTDPTWDNVDAYVWSVIENSLALICASLAAMKPLLSHFLPKIFGSRLDESKESGREAGVRDRELRVWKCRGVNSGFKDLPGESPEITGDMSENTLTSFTTTAHSVDSNDSRRIRQQSSTDSEWPILGWAEVIRTKTVERDMILTLDIDIERGGKFM